MPGTFYFLSITQVTTEAFPQKLGYSCKCLQRTCILIFSWFHLRFKVNGFCSITFSHWIESIFFIDFTYLITSFLVSIRWAWPIGHVRTQAKANTATIRCMAGLGQQRHWVLSSKGWLDIKLAVRFGRIPADRNN
jgi:hypothetical protein